MSFKSVPAALALCACAALLAAGCASPAPRNEGDAAPLAALSSQTNAGNLNARAGADEKVKSPLPAPTGFVNDYAGALGAEAKRALEAKLTRLKEHARIEFAVAIIETTGGVSIDDYSLSVARGWGVGPPKGQGGGGLLLLVAIKDRKWRLQVSRALEADLPDEASAEIGARMTPHLRRGDYGAAVGECVEGVVRRLAPLRGFDSEDVLGAQVGTIEINTKD